jgi:hypothetical protein
VDARAQIRRGCDLQHRFGAALFGALTLVSNRIEAKPLPVTQTIGLPPPYKPAPEANAAQNALNFASENRYSNYVR